ncbi:MAG: hypothetical protein SOR93_03615 [Clostridiales Family XIII bacterium]|uniref:Uncharacterized protein n=1 Tax=Hominibacterium faecale TaxID=2839743 RepID=A0A9J6QZK8_9FIRM|nr:hypothetical protein [Hominibacterium faecale]MCU7380966.1 hypothetical protein [Hominibacterium faecale]MDY3010335.1 hypothetical protein [Clostridiales Family XIII bacterium]
MIPVTDKYKNTDKYNRHYQALVKVQLADTTMLTIDDDNIMSGGLSIETATSQSNSFEIGSMVIGKLTLRISNADEEFTPYDFTNAVITPQIGLDLEDGTAEWLDKGVFTSERAATSGSVWTITAYDNMARLDQDYSKSNLTYPATVRQIANDACNICGLVLSGDSFAGENYIINKRPEGDNLTFRAVLSYCAQITGNYGYCDTQGRLAFGWYDADTLRHYGYDGGRFDDYDINAYTTGDTCDGGTFYDYTDGDTYDEGTFEQWAEEHSLYDVASLNVDLWDVLITGVRVNTTEMFTVETTDDEGNVETTEEERSASYLYGEEGYVITIENNPLIPCSKVKEVAEQIGSRIVGVRFRPLDVTMQSDPCIEAGDLATVTDYRGLTYSTILTNVTYTLGGNSKYSCGAVSASEQASQRPSVADQKLEQVKKHTDAKIQNHRTEMQRLTGLVTKSLGIFKTEVRQSDGSAIFYMHDRPKLEESQTIWRMSAGVFSVSTDGGKTWNAGIDAQGNAVVNMLSAIGINFDWARGGQLTLGGRSNANGTFRLLANDDSEMIVMNYDGIKLAGGASLMSANGVCGNLQFISNGGAPAFLGSGTELYLEGMAGSIYIYANIPDNYVVEKAILTLKSNAGVWNKWESDGTVTGYSRNIRLYKGTSNAGLAMGGDLPGNADIASVGDWDQITSGGFLTAGIAGSMTQATKTVVSGNLAPVLSNGLNVLRLAATESSAAADTAMAYVGTGIAILDVIGYSKN